MATEKRRPGSSVEQRLFEEWYRYSFFSAVHLLETLSPEKQKLGTTLDPGKEAVRFSVRPGLDFPASDIGNLMPGADDQPATMDVTFMGLIGPSGLLPYWYNELAVNRARRKDYSLVSFLNIFHHRLISLFYLAWKKQRFAVNFLPGAKDKLSGYLLSLCGLGTPGLAGRIGFAEESLSFYSGLLSRMMPSGSSICATIEHFTGTHVEIEQCIQRLILLDDADLTRLGGANSSLGVNTMVGRGAWECQTKFRLRLGPMNYSAFSRLLPSGDMHGPTFSLIRYMVGIEYEFELTLVLHGQEVPPCVIGRPGPDSPRLGWSTWLISPGVTFREDQEVTFHEADAL